LDTISQKYLISTSINLFHNIDLENSILLGNWCIPNDMHHKIAKEQIFRFIWSNRKKYEEAYFDSINIFEDMLLFLKDEINSRLKQNFDIQFYRVVLSPWLIHYIHQSYDKYINIFEVFEENKNIIAYTLNVKNNIIPVDYTDFIELTTNSGIYNLQQYSQIVKYLEYNHKDVTLKKEQKQKNIYKTKTNKMRYIVDKTCSYISSKVHNQSDLTNITSPYFHNKLSKYKLWFFGKFKYILDDMDYDLSVELNIDREKRKNHSQLSKKSYINYLKENIFNDIPLLYFENICRFNDIVKSLPIKKCKIFYTANAHYSSEIYKFYIAANYDKTTSIISQHGGVNGTHLLSLEEIDHQLADYIFTFGWKDRANEIPMYSFNSSLLYKTFKHTPKKNEILLISTAQPKNIFRLHSSYSADEFQVLINNSIDFLNVLNKYNVKFRGYPNDYGWNTNDTLEKNIISQLNYDNNKKILDSYKTAEIVVSNHIGTTYLEAISLNIPTVVFCDDNVTKFRDSTNDIYTKLFKVGIFHKNGNSAALFIKNLYETDGLNKWWNSIEIENVKKEFVQKYSNLTDNWYSKFNEQIDKLKENNDK